MTAATATRVVPAAIPASPTALVRPGTKGVTAPATQAARDAAIARSEETARLARLDAEMKARQAETAAVAAQTGPLAASCGRVVTDAAALEADASATMRRHRVTEINSKTASVTEAIEAAMRRKLRVTNPELAAMMHFMANCYGVSHRTMVSAIAQLQPTAAESDIRAKSTAIAAVREALGLKA